MNPCTDSRIRIQVADSRFMLGHKDGTLHMNVNKLSLALSDEAHQNASTLAGGGSHLLML
jgi:hypothetical protein